MIHAIEAFFSSFPPALAVFFMAMLPVTEMRLSIPFGVTVLGMTPLWASIWSLAGNIIASLLIISLLGPVTKFLMSHSKIANKGFNWLFERTHKKHSKRMSELGSLALGTFVAIPLPGSGGWTGSLVAFVFGVPKRKAMLVVSLGLIATALIMGFGTAGILKLHLPLP